LRRKAHRCQEWIVTASPEEAVDLRGEPRRLVVHDEVEAAVDAGEDGARKAA
jgi:hypothetical protein